MKSFKSFILAEAHRPSKVALRYDRGAGDREKVTKQFLSDKKKLKPNERAIMRRYFRAWKASRGQDAIFELKASIRFKTEGPSKPTTLIYGVEVQKRQPPFHVIGIKETVNGGKNNLFIWTRIFTDYNSYGDYISNLKNQNG